MPNKNPGQSQGHQPQGQQHNGGNAGSTFQEFGQQVQERAGQVGDQVREGLNTARESVSENYRRAGEVVASHPASSVLAGFGVGFGLGVLLTVLFHKSESESWYDRYMPEGLRNVPDRLRHLHVPEAIARHMPGH